MPRVKPLIPVDKVRYQKELESYKCEKALLKHHIKKKEVAELLDISPAALTQQFKSKSITFDTYLAVQLLVESKGEQFK